MDWGEIFTTTYASSERGEPAKLAVGEACDSLNGLNTITSSVSEVDSSTQLESSSKGVSGEDLDTAIIEAEVAFGSEM